MFRNSPAMGVGETCQGRQATIVGIGHDVAGTSGDDVIVTGVSVTINAGAGDDLICVAPRNEDTEVLRGSRLVRMSKLRRQAV